MELTLVRDVADDFFGKMTATAEKFVKDAQAFVNEVPNTDPVFPVMQSRLYEFDMKVRESIHRVSDLCALSVQTAKAASEKV